MIARLCFLLAVLSVTLVAALQYRRFSEGWWKNWPDVSLNVLGKEQVTVGGYIDIEGTMEAHMYDGKHYSILLTNPYAEKKESEHLYGIFFMEHREIGFVFNSYESIVDWEKGVTKSTTWGNEEWIHFYLEPNVPFRTRITIFEDFFRVAVNGCHVHDFENRYPQKRIRMLGIHGYFLPACIRTLMTPDGQLC